MAALLLVRSLRACPQALVAVNAKWAGDLDDVVVVLPGHSVPLLCMQLKHQGWVTELGLRESKKGVSVYEEWFRNDFRAEALWKRPELQVVAPSRAGARFVFFTRGQVKSSSQRVAEEALVQLLNTGDAGCIRYLDPGSFPDTDRQFLDSFVLAGDQADAHDLLVLLEQEVAFQSGLLPGLLDATRRFLSSVEEHTRREGELPYIDGHFPGWRQLRRDLHQETALVDGVLCSPDFALDLGERVLEAAAQRGLAHVLVEGACLQLRSCVLAQAVRACGKRLLLARACDLNSGLRPGERSVLDLWGPLRPVLVLDTEGSPDPGPLAQRLLGEARIKDPSCILLLLSARADVSLSHVDTCRVDLRYQDLDSASRSRLGSAHISLQGRDSQPVAGVVSEQHLRHFGCPEISRLLRRTFALGSKLLEVHPDNYISRYFGVGVTLADNVLEDLPHIFFLEGTSEEEVERYVDSQLITSVVECVNIEHRSQFADTRVQFNILLPNVESVFPGRRYFIFSGKGEPKMEFRQLCHIKEFRPIHWLERAEEGFVWKATEGDTEGLLPFLSGNRQRLVCSLQESRVSEDKLLEVGEPRVVLCAPSGMGKSSTLSHAATKASGRFPDRWVLLWNLADSHHQFKSLSPSSETDMKQCIEGVLQEVAGVRGPEGGCLGDALWRKGNVMLFVDALDEITPSYDKISLSVLRILAASPVQVLWVATTESARHSAERALKVQSLSLLPLTDEEQRGLFAGCADEDFVRGNLTLLSKYLALPNHPPASGNPLYLKMFADSLRGRAAAESDWTYDIGDLYSSFLGTLLNRQIRIELEKHHADVFLLERYLSGIFEMYRNSALIALLPDELHTLIPSVGIGENQNKMEKAARDGKSGLLRTTADGRAAFVHRTFAEYLAAQWMSLHWEDGAETKAAVARVLTRPHASHVRVFFDSIATRDLHLHRSVLARSLDHRARSPGDLSVEDSVGRTALHLAAQRGDREMLESLHHRADGGADLDRPDALWGLSPLYHAVRANAWDCVRLLVGLGARVGNDILTPELASRLVTRFQIPVPKALEINWPIVEFQNKTAMSLLQVAAAVGATEIVQELYPTAVRSHHSKYVSNLLHIAAEHGRQETVQCLIRLIKEFEVEDSREAGCKQDVRCLTLESKDSLGRTPLLVSVQHGRKDIVRVLLEEGADPTAEDDNGMGVFHLNAPSGDLEITGTLVRELTSAKADDATRKRRRKKKCALKEFVSRQDRNGCAPLHLAVQNGHRDLVKELLDLNAETSPAVTGASYVTDTRKVNHDSHCYSVDVQGVINVVRCRGFTPLHFAALYNHAKIVNLLLNRKADVHATDALGRTALHVAASSGDCQMADFLLQHDADPSARDGAGKTPLHYAVGSRKTDLTKKLLKKTKGGASVRDAYGVTPLCEAILVDSTALIRLLVDKFKADINDVNEKLDGLTPLHLAIARSSVDTVRELLDAKLPNGLTPLHLACFLGRGDVVRMLIEVQGKAGLEKKVRNLTPLHMAADEGHADIVDFLVGKGADLSARTSFKYTPLHIAAGRGRTEAVRRLISSHGANVLEKADGECTPLHLAAQEGHLEAVRLLAVTREAVFAVDERGASPLHAAASNGRTEVAEELISLGAGDEKTNCGYSPLHGAALGGHTECASMLLDKKFDVEARSLEGHTPIMLSCLHGRSGTCRLLMNRLADVQAKDHKGLTPLHMACQEGHLEVAKLLLGKAQVNATDSCGRTPLHVAAFCGKAEVAALLMGHGADRLAKDQDGYTPLHGAALEGHAEVARLLLGEGVEVDARNAEGDTPLMLASYKGHAEVAKLLLDHDADIGASEREYTCLYLAVQEGREEVVKQLLEKRPDVNQRCEGRTPLHLAAKCGRGPIGELLLRHGADGSISDPDGHTPLHYAATTGNEILARALLKEGVQVDARNRVGVTPLMCASLEGKTQTAQLLIDSKADASVKDLHGNTALHHAVAVGSTGMVELLLQKRIHARNTPAGDDCGPLFSCPASPYTGDVDLDARDQEGNTPLILALCSGHVQIAKLLLDHGVDISIANEDGYTALHAGAQGGHADIVKILLDKKANPNAPTKNHITPLYSAVANGHRDVVELLLKNGANVRAKAIHDYTLLHVAADNGDLEMGQFLLTKDVEWSAKNTDGKTAVDVATERGHTLITALLSTLPNTH